MDFETLQAKVDHFADEVSPGLASSLLGAGRVVADIFSSRSRTKQLWDEAKEIQEGFNSRPRFPSRASREECWKRFQEARSALADASRGEREGRQNTSRQHRDHILSLIREARVHGNTGSGRDGADYLRDAGRKLAHAGAYFKDHKHAMLGEDKKECSEAFQEVRDDHTARWEEIRAGRESRASERRARIIANIAKNREAYHRCAEALGRQRQRESDLEAQISESWNPNWQERASGWLSECREKIASMEESLARLERWIQEGEDKL